MNTAEKLHAIGWRVRTSEELDNAVRRFQLGYILGPALKVDGIAGPLTTRALDQTLDHGGRITAHFRWVEFQCHCRQTLAGCDGIVVRPELASALEPLRAEVYPRGLLIVSGYRCPQHNADQHGARMSQHLRGAAIDVPPVASVAQVERLQDWRGIGYGATSKKVVHLDMRPDATPRVPAVFPDGK